MSFVSALVVSTPQPGQSTDSMVGGEGFTRGMIPPAFVKAEGVNNATYSEKSELAKPTTFGSAAASICVAVKSAAIAGLVTVIEKVSKPSRAVLVVKVPLAVLPLCCRS